MSCYSLIYPSDGAVRSYDVRPMTPTSFDEWITDTRSLTFDEYMTEMVWT